MVNKADPAFPTLWRSFIIKSGFQIIFWILKTPQICQDMAWNVKPGSFQFLQSYFFDFLSLIIFCPYSLWFVGSPSPRSCRGGPLWHPTISEELFEPRRMWLIIQIVSFRWSSELVKYKIFSLLGLGLTFPILSFFLFYWKPSMF